MVSRLALVVALVSLAVALAPPHRIRQFRHSVAEGAVWSWIKSAKLFRLIHDEFWSDGNGNSKYEMGTDDFYERQV